MGEREREREREKDIPKEGDASVEGARKINVYEHITRSAEPTDFSLPLLPLSRVMCAWVMSYVNESCPMSMSRVPCQ